MKTPLRIAFILPAIAKSPVGGYKVVYEYANRLSERGHFVTVVHLVGLDNSDSMRDNVLTLLKWLVRKMFGRRNIVRWFPVKSKVDLRVVRNIKEVAGLSVDVAVATAWQTAEKLAETDSNSTQAYLIQHLETWHGNEERVLATWHSSLHKIVIARWLQDFGKSIGENSYYLPNGLDFEKFYITTKIEDRSDPVVMMLYHTASDKGSADAIAALSMTRDRVPALKGIAYGASRRPALLPKWISYYQRPSQELLRALYNKAQIFVTPSLVEGWGLPACEAMCCGAALVATDIGGHREFAINGQNALLSPPKNAALLASNIELLLRDGRFRKHIATQGHLSIQRFTWELSVTRIDQYLRKIIGEADREPRIC